MSGVSVWRQVRALEEAFGVQLVDTQGQQVVRADDDEVIGQGASVSPHGNQ